MHEDRNLTSHVGNVPNIFLTLETPNPPPPCSQDVKTHSSITIPCLRWPCMQSTELQVVKLARMREKWWQWWGRTTEDVRRGLTWMGLSGAGWQLSLRWIRAACHNHIVQKYSLHVQYTYWSCEHLQPHCTIWPSMAVYLWQCYKGGEHVSEVYKCSWRQNRITHDHVLCVPDILGVFTTQNDICRALWCHPIAP